MDSRRRPAALTSRSRSSACVPAKRSLDPAEVTKLGLHFDDEEASGRFLKCEHIDPPGTERSVDLDLRFDAPSEAPKPTRHVGHATSVDSIALGGSVLEEWSFEAKSDASPESACDPFHGGQVDGAREASLEP